MKIETLWDLRQYIESHIPWWLPLLGIPVAIAVIGYYNLVLLRDKLKW